MSETVEHGTLSRRAFAEACGVNHTWVNRKVKAGLLPANEHGIPVPEGFEAFDKIKAEEAKPARTQSAEIQLALAAAKCKEKEAQARLKELELKEREGELVRIDDVLADARKIGTMLRDKLYNLPPRMSSILFACKSERELEATLEDEIDRIIREIHHASDYLEDEPEAVKKP